jgi:uncharacterized delta-60 repeat protein
MQKAILATLLLPLAALALLDCGSDDAGGSGGGGGTGDDAAVPLGGDSGANAPVDGSTADAPADVGADAPDGSTADAGGFAPGGLDPTFGANGLVVTAMRDGSDLLGDVAVQPDGKIVAIGRDATNERLVLFRFDAAGAYDATFGKGGKVLVPPRNVTGTELLLQSDGKIVTLFGLSRFDTTGAVDTTWGTGGSVTLGFGPRAMAIQADDKIVLAGRDGTLHPTVARLTASGAVDTTFGVAGYTTISSNLDHVIAVAVDAAGRSLVLTETGGTVFVLTRLTAAGAIDTTFGGTGSVTTQLRFNGFSGTYFVGRPLAVQPDGKVLVAGRGTSGPANNQCVLARFDTAGALDTTFDTDGYTADFCSYGSSSDAIRVDPNGRIVVLRSSQGSDTLLRFDASGAFDTTFASTGHAQVGSHFSHGLAIQPDARILTAGAVKRTQNADDAQIARTSADGTADATFGTGGVVTANAGASWDHARAVQVLPDGAILAGGQAGEVDPIGFDFTLAKYTPSGALDTTFGVAGKAILDSTAESQIAGFGVDGSGKIVVGGGHPFAAARFTAAGAPDATFGVNGVTVFHVVGGEGYSYAYGFALDASDRPILSGTCSTTSGRMAALVRLTTAGAPDTTFATNGAYLSPPDNRSLSMNTYLATAIQPDGKILATGVVGIPNGVPPSKGLLLQRFDANGVPDPTFTGSSGGTDGFVGRAIAVQGDGKIVVAGSDLPPGYMLPIDQNDYAVISGTKVLVRRFGADGKLDTAFGTGGTLATTLGFPAPASLAAFAVTDEAGSIYVAGAFGGPPRGFLTRLTSAGAVDTSFGANGVIVTSAPGVESVLSALAKQPDGKIVASGYVFQSPTANDFLLLRLQ